jgi:hypothetical protein
LILGQILAVAVAVVLVLVLALVLLQQDWEKVQD